MVTATFIVDIRSFLRHVFRWNWGCKDFICTFCIRDGHVFVIFLQKRIDGNSLGILMNTSYGSSQMHYFNISILKLLSKNTSFYTEGKFLYIILIIISHKIFFFRTIRYLPHQIASLSNFVCVFLQKRIDANSCGILINTRYGGIQMQYLKFL